MKWLGGSAHSGYIPNDNPFSNGEIPAIAFSSPVSATCLTYLRIARLDVQIIWLKLYDTRFWKQVSKTAKLKNIQPYLLKLIDHFSEKKRVTIHFIGRFKQKICNYPTWCSLEIKSISPISSVQKLSESDLLFFDSRGCIFIVTRFIYLQPKWPYFDWKRSCFDLGALQK